MARQGHGQHLIEVQTRAVRIGGGPDLVQKDVVQLVAENQRQAGDAEHQQEAGRDEARPFMDPGPGAEGAGLHPVQKSVDSDSLKVRGAPRVR